MAVLPNKLLQSSYRSQVYQCVLEYFYIQLLVQQNVYHMQIINHVIIKYILENK